MNIKLSILNPENFKPKDCFVHEDEKKDIENGPTWYSRNKSYEWDYSEMDDDVKNCTVAHTVQYIELNNIYLTSKKNIRELIEFLEKAEKSMQV